MSASASASRAEISLVYFAAVVQGLALVTFPAASAIFTSPEGFGFDSTRYGTMFLPQVVLAVLASGLAPKLARRWGLRRILLVGFAGDLISMALLAASRLLLDAPDLAFGLLLVATGALGLGFGATVMALNTYAETFFPDNADRAVLLLNALLGLGTALAPVLVAVSVVIGAWWLLPGRRGMHSGVDLCDCSDAAAESPSRDRPVRRLSHDQLVESAASLLALCQRGICLWHPGDAQRQLGDAVSQRRAGRVGTRCLVRADCLLGLRDGGARAHCGDFQACASPLDYFGLTILLVLVFQLASRVQTETGGIIAFGIVGLACSAFLPLSISFGGKEFPRLSAVMAGELIAFYQIGYGVAAFGIGPLHDLIGLPFSTIFASGSIVAALLAVIALFVVRRPPASRLGEQ